MYTAIVGRTLLDTYNQRNNTDLSAKAFFDHELFRQVFNAERYLMWAVNSPFVQGISKKKPFFTAEERLEKLAAFHKKVAAGERDASIALGFPAAENKGFATTSGAITDLVVDIDDETVYLSWIGGTLALGVAGGYTLLFDDPDITYATFEGWQYYRAYLNDPILKKLLPNKLTSWNGQWLAYRFSSDYRTTFNFSDLQKNKLFVTDGKGNIGPPAVAWSRLYFHLAKELTQEQVMAYVFSLGQTNKSIGFIPFGFKAGRRLIDTYQQLFGEEEYHLNKASEFEEWYGRHIKRACELGSIGIQALRPPKLLKYVNADIKLKLVSTKINAKKGETEEEFKERIDKARAKERTLILTYQTYKTWLITMLSKNKTEISNYSRDIAQSLVQYRAGARKMDRKNLLEKDFFKTSKREMLKALDKIVSDESVTNEIAEKMNSLRDQVHFLGKEEFSYFILLLKFDYAYAERGYSKS